MPCAKCCRYYIAPETAPCGHSLCHSCWKGRRTCPCCDATVTCHTLKPNVPLQTHTEHLKALADDFETLFNVKLDEIDLDILEPIMQSNDPTQKVKEWLASSQKQFSVPSLSPQASSPPIGLNASKIQIQTQSNKQGRPTKVHKTPPPQDDLDKIETYTDTNNIPAENKENIVCPMDIEPFAFDENEYNNNHPHRSHQRKDTIVPITRTIRTRSIDKNGSKNSESETDRKSKTSQHWSNVKKMKKELIKLNRVNKGNLNVSIEMCKKARGAKAKSKVALPLQATERPPYDIEYDLPDKAQNTVDNKNAPGKNNNINLTDIHLQEISSNNGIIKKMTIKEPTSKPVLLEDKCRVDDYSSGNKQTYTEDLQSSRNNEGTTRSVHLPFSQKEEKKANEDTDIQIVQNEINSQDDVEISIKISNTVTNIYIKQKHVSLKVNAGSAIQISVGPHHLKREMCDKGTNANLAKETSEKGVNVHLIELELGDENKVTANKSCTTRLHTASADIENVVSMIENEPQAMVEKPQEVTDNLKNITEKSQPQLATSGQQDIENTLMLGMCRDLDMFRGSTQAEKTDVETLPLEKLMGISITTIRNISFQKPRARSDTSNSECNIDKLLLNKESDVSKSSNSQSMQPVNQSELLTPADPKAPTVVNNVGSAQTGKLTTPPTITTFFKPIQHTSTPSARKKLNFENDSRDDERTRTLCHTTISLENDFLAKAFEDGHVSPVKRSLSLTNMCHKATSNYCLAASGLRLSDIIEIKLLCKKQEWTYMDKYTEQLTHLVVAVDKEERSQRTVKYMCALAASKLIVSFAWVERCLSDQGVVDEAAYEVLDASGEPGPSRSRRARHKLFSGIAFYCKPPFKALDLGALQYMLRSAGGLVADSMQEVRLTGPGSEAGVKLVLAEPEITQKDEFIYLTMEQSIVPVNFEWALNCLGSYDLRTIRDLLLCPTTLLPKAVAAWPAALLKEEDEDE